MSILSRETSALLSVKKRQIITNYFFFITFYTFFLLAGINTHNIYIRFLPKAKIFLAKTLKALKGTVKTVPLSVIFMENYTSWVYCRGVIPYSFLKAR